MQLKNSNHNILSIDIGATNTRFATFDNNYNIINLIKIKTPKINFFQIINDQIEQIINNLKIKTISISIAGPVKNGVVKSANIKGAPIIKISDFQNKAKNIFMINDAEAAVIAESYQHKARNIVYITISSGIGVGIIKDNRIVKINNISEEMGHHEILSNYKLICGCGGVNHWEAYCSGLNIINYYNEWCRENKITPLKINSPQKLFDSVTNNPEIKNFLIDEIGKINAIGINLIIENYQPNIVVIGGSVAINNKEIILSGIDKYLAVDIPIYISSLGDNICLIGAAIHAHNELSKKTICDSMNLR